MTNFMQNTLLREYCNYNGESVMSKTIKIAKKELNMKVHEFTLVLSTDPNEEESDRLYSITL